MMSGNERSLVAAHGFEGPPRAGSWPTSRNESKGAAIVTNGQGAVAVEEGVSQANAMDFRERAGAGTQQTSAHVLAQRSVCSWKEEAASGTVPCKVRFAWYLPCTWSVLSGLLTRGEKRELCVQWLPKFWPFNPPMISGRKFPTVCVPRVPHNVFVRIKTEREPHAHSVSQWQSWD